MWIKANDTVKVITGEDRGATGKVLRMERKKGKLVVEGVNRVYKHVRRSQKNPQGGRLSKEMPIAICNVQLVCESCGAAARIGVRYLDNGAKERYCKKCGAGNGQVAPPKACYGKK
jgi:large subunit ribosomal protein L24